MTYIYKCEKCNKEVSIDKPMSEASKEEKCVECKNKLVRVFTKVGINTFGDGVKV